MALSSKVSNWNWRFEETNAVLQTPPLPTFHQKHSNFLITLGAPLIDFYARKQRHLEFFAVMIVSKRDIFFIFLLSFAMNSVKMSTDIKVHIKSLGDKNASPSLLPCAWL